MKVQSARLPSGITLQYVEQGNQAGTPVVFLHGGTDSWRSFELVFPYLPDSIRAFALSLRGHGDSSRPATGYRYTDFAADIDAFMDLVGLRSAVIVGHSMGRAIAQRFALDYTRTKGLMLLGAFSGDANNPVIVDLEKTISTFTDTVDPKFVREFQISTLSQPVPASFLETVIAESMKVPAHVWREVFVALRDDDVAAELDQISVPTVVTSGNKDGFADPAEVARLTATIPGARLIVYPEAGHAPHWEEPARFASDVTSFVDGII